MTHSFVVTINGVKQPVAVEPDRTLLSVLRNEVGLTGPKEGCDDSECGACMVLLDGQPINSCSYLAIQAADRRVITVEGLGHGGDLDPLQAAFLSKGGAQCGYCTPGMLIAARALLDRNPAADEAEIREGLAGNLCRCTGYRKIVDAVRSVAADVGAQPATRTADRLDSDA